MAITCNECGKSVPEEKVTLSGLVKCEACGSVFRPGEKKRETSLSRHKKIRVGALGGIDMRPTSEGLEIIRRWFDHRVWFTLGMALFWNGLFYWFVWLSGGEFLQSEESILFYLFGFGGLCWAYVAFAHLFNQTTIRMTSETIVVRHRPVPWLGNKTVPVAKVAQVYCKRIKQRRKHRTYVTFEVRFEGPKGKTYKLLSGLESRSEARFIEREIEETLGLQDKYVEGEHWY